MGARLCLCGGELPGFLVTDSLFKIGATLILDVDGGVGVGLCGVCGRLLGGFLELNKLQHLVLHFMITNTITIIKSKIKIPVVFEYVCQFNL